MSSTSDAEAVGDAKSRLAIVAIALRYPDRAVNPGMRDVVSIGWTENISGVPGRGY
ncbi:MAG: hypothetical protein WBW88_04915 [Rhodothermales bacterium]